MGEEGRPGCRDTRECHRFPEGLRYRDELRYFFTEQCYLLFALPGLQGCCVKRHCALQMVAMVLDDSECLTVAPVTREHLPPEASLLFAVLMVGRFTFLRLARHTDRARRVTLAFLGSPILPVLPGHHLFQALRHRWAGFAPRRWEFLAIPARYSVCAELDTTFPTASRRPRSFVARRHCL